MIVAIASGKGGTGKTTVAASLATVWEKPLVAVDLDVEEPNLHLFLRPDIDERTTAFLEIPVHDGSKCTRCGSCAELCQFKAITVMGGIVLTFPELCHGCGGCLLVCPEKALSPGKRELGEIDRGRTAGGVDFLAGRLRVGEAMSPPFMREVKAAMNAVLAVGSMDAVVDAPPGVSCPAVNAVMDCDVIVLVTEPTPFGLHDLKLAREAFSPLGIPMGVVINRAGLGDGEVRKFCSGEGIPVLAEIPFSRAVAETYARGGIIAELSAEFRQIFISLSAQIRRLAKEAAHA